jgi:hypothetical protein
MVEKTRALPRDRSAPGTDGPVDDVAPPIMTVSNRATATQLGAEAGAPIRRDDLAGLGGVAGNRAVLHRVEAQGGPVPGLPPAGPVLTGPVLTGPVLAGPVQAPGPTPAPVTAPAPEPAEPPIDWIAGLPEHIQTQIDTFSQKVVDAQSEPRKKALEDQRTTNRKTFMRTMHWLFGSYAAVQAHFADIKPMDNSGSYPLWAHVSTRERLQAAKDLLKAQNTPMPQTDVGLGMRGDHLHTAGKGPGWYTHATGFAVDWRAYQAPRITDTKLITLFETVTGGTPHLEFNMSIEKRLDVIEKMGQKTATAAESQSFLDRLDVEYKRLVADSDKFKTDLPAASLATLREVETARTAVAAAKSRQKRIKADRKSTKDQIETAQHDVDAAVTAFDEKKAAATTQLAKIFEPWTKKLDAEIAAIDKTAQDNHVDLEELTGTYGFSELRGKIDTLTVQKRRLEATAKGVLTEVLQIHHDALVIAAKTAAAREYLAAPGKDTLPAASSTWGTDLDDVEAKNNAVIAGLTPLKTTLAGEFPTAVLEPKPVPAVKATPVKQATVTGLKSGVEKLSPRVTAAGAKLTPAATDLAQATTDLAATKQDLTGKTAYRAEKVTELGGGTDRAAKARGEAAVGALLEKKIKWLNLKNAKEALLTDAQGFVFKPAATDDPGMTQLLGLMGGTRGGGIFTPDPETGGEADARAGKWSDTNGFNLAFMKAMVSSGFELGVAWKGGSDTMHFELVEGRRLLTSAGQHPLVAGQTLKATEDKAAADKAAADKAAADKAAADKAAAKP